MRGLTDFSFIDVACLCQAQPITKWATATQPRCPRQNAHYNESKDQPHDQSSNRLGLNAATCDGLVCKNRLVGIAAHLCPYTPVFRGARIFSSLADRPKSACDGRVGGDHSAAACASWAMLPLWTRFAQCFHPKRGMWSMSTGSTA